MLPMPVLTASNIRVTQHYNSISRVTVIKYGQVGLDAVVLRP
jgi:hypothetical protein